MSSSFTAYETRLQVEDTGAQRSPRRSGLRDVSPGVYRGRILLDVESIQCSTCQCRHRWSCKYWMSMLNISIDCVARDSIFFTIRTECQIHCGILQISALHYLYEICQLLTKVTKRVGSMIEYSRLPYISWI